MSKKEKVIFCIMGIVFVGLFILACVMQGNNIAESIILFFLLTIFAISSIYFLLNSGRMLLNRYKRLLQSYYEVVANYTQLSESYDLKSKDYYNSKYMKYLKKFCELEAEENNIQAFQNHRSKQNWLDRL